MPVSAGGSKETGGGGRYPEMSARGFPWVLVWARYVRGRISGPGFWRGRECRGWIGI